jgi:hypothetical protein
LNGERCILLSFICACLVLAGCRQGPVENALDAVKIGNSRIDVESKLQSRGIQFKFRPPLENLSATPKELIQEEALTSPTIVIFVAEPYDNLSTKTTRIIVVFDRNDLVSRVQTQESYLGP